MVKTFDKYFINLFFKKILLMFVIFFSLIFILTIFEEITFFSDTKTEFYLPFLVAMFDVPSTLLEIFPFVILISVQLFFLEVMKKRENELIKVNGLDNFYLIKLLTLCAFLFGIIIITVYYPFSSKLKFIYFDLKNLHSKDGKYLKHYSENGLWIKDEINNEIFIINSSTKIKNEFLDNVFISRFDKDFNLVENIFSKKVDIKTNTWIVEKPIYFKNNKQIQSNDDMTLESHFNIEKINKTFMNLNSFNFAQLVDAKKENELLGYSSQDIDLHILKIITLPVYFSIMVIISSIIMLNINRNRPYVFHVILGITLSVVIYYMNNIFNIFGLTNKIPISLSVVFPIIILSIFSIIGLLRINEK
tara:strand:- start:1848 stop:2930 length:1083 start_codon:yes stop_codon:yes gene_type:complete